MNPNCFVRSRDSKGLDRTWEDSPPFWCKILCCLDLSSSWMSGSDPPQMESQKRSSIVDLPCLRSKRNRARVVTQHDSIAVSPQCLTCTFKGDPGVWGAEYPHGPLRWEPLERRGYCSDLRVFMRPRGARLQVSKDLFTPINCFFSLPASSGTKETRHLKPKTQSSPCCPSLIFLHLIC